jgi:hypothetical protein
MFTYEKCCERLFWDLHRVFPCIDGPRWARSRLGVSALTYAGGQVLDTILSVLSHGVSTCSVVLSHGVSTCSVVPIAHMCTYQVCLCVFVACAGQNARGRGQRR